MNVTNTMNLPQALVDAVDVNPHNKEGCISATTLLKGACNTILTKRHWDDITEDASDRIWAIFGTAVHALLEKESAATFTEETVSVKVGSYTVTGKFDCYDMENEILFDYKTTSVWKVIYKSFDDYKRQGLIYSWLLKQQGINVKKCRFVMMLKDHSKTDAKVKADYPKSPVYVYEFDVTDKDLSEIESYVQSKVALIEKYESLPDAEMPECSKEERWHKEGKIAVYKKGGKRAFKLYDYEDEELAKQCAETIGGTLEYRRGSDGMCEGYCACNSWCPYYQNLLKEMESEIPEEAAS